MREFRIKTLTMTGRDVNKILRHGEVYSEKYFDNIDRLVKEGFIEEVKEPQQDRHKFWKDKNKAEQVQFLKENGYEEIGKLKTEAARIKAILSIESNEH